MRSEFFAKDNEDSSTLNDQMFLARLKIKKCQNATGSLERRELMKTGQTEETVI